MKRQASRSNSTWSVSYLPSSGDQFSALSQGTLILQPQRFDNKEVGLKWNINPKLLLAMAVYQLNRTNQPIADLLLALGPFTLATLCLYRAASFVAGRREVSREAGDRASVIGSASD